MPVYLVALYGGVEGAPRVLRPGGFFCLAKMRYFFSYHPVVLQFKESPYGNGLLSIMHEVVVFPVDSLREFYDNHAGLGGYEPSWKS